MGENRPPKLNPKNPLFYNFLPILPNSLSYSLFPIYTRRFLKKKKKKKENSYYNYY